MRVLEWATFMLAATMCALAETPTTAKSIAPTETDFTGYWVSLVTEDWRWRMVTPAKGDYASVPLTIEGREVADTWSPTKDDAAGEQCRSYAAPIIMRVPGRLHISWQDEETLRVEIDTGRQTRLLHFDKWNAPAGPPTWQGNTAASWELERSRDPGARVKHGSIKTVTTHLRPGYLRKNGVPYSAKAELTEYWDVNREPNGTQILVVTTAVHDPIYLQRDWITALHFKKEPDGSKWDPQPCSAYW
jgi:ABC-type transport system substrate-binding protein